QALAEPGDARVGLDEGLRRDRGAVCALGDVLERERPVGLRGRALEGTAAVVAELHGHVRYPELTLLDLPRCPAARLEVPPDDAGDPAGEGLRHNRLRRVARHVLLADPGEAKLGDAPGP